MIIIAYSFINAIGKGNETPSDYLIVSYSQNLGGINIFRGNEKKPEVITCNLWNNNCVVDLLSELQSEGYVMMSTTNSSSPDNSIVIFLKRIK